MECHLPALRSVRPLLLLAGLALVTGCGSNLVDLDLPGSVAPGGDVEAEVTHAYDGEAFFDAFGDADESSYIFSAVIPEDWTPLGGGSYSGTLDGTGFQRDVSIISAPPETNLLEVLTEDELEEEIPEEIVPFLNQSFCDETPPEVPSGSQLVWYQTDGQLPGVDAMAGDGGTLTVDYRAGDELGSAELTYQHAVYVAGEEVPDPNEAPVDVTICFWFLSEESSSETELVPEMISRAVNVISGAGVGGAGGEARVIPTLGGVGLILLSLLLAATGAWAGRRGQRKP